MKVLIWIGCIFVASFLNAILGEITGFKIGYLLFYLGVSFIAILTLIEQGKIDTTPLITHRYQLEDIEEACHIFENKLDGAIKIAIEP